MKLGAFGGHKGEGQAKRGIAQLAGGLPVLLLALAAWVVALAGAEFAPVVRCLQPASPIRVFYL